MILASLLQKRFRYETTAVEHICIEPIFLVPSPSPDPSFDEGEIQFDFNANRIVNNGHGVYWIDENHHDDEEKPLTLPGTVDDPEKEDDQWFEPFSYPEKTDTQPVFNLLPNGKRRKRSFWRTLFKRSTYRRAAYAIDSRTTSLTDIIADSSGKVRGFFKNVMERLTPTENSWTNLENLLAETNNHLN